MKVSRRHAVIWPLALGFAAGFAAVMAVTVAVARTIVIPPRSKEEGIEIVSVDVEAGTITFARSPDSIIDGRYSLWFSGTRGHARVGEVLTEAPDTVTRELLAVEFGNLDGVRRGRFGGWFYLSPGDLGVEYEDVVIDTELGPAPAWLVPAPRSTKRAASDTSTTGSDRWVIQIHGRAVVRTEAIRAIPVFRDAGYTSLLISYRNDSEAPSSEDGRYALGDTEWQDVDAALRYALDHGARSVVLMGWSMGGATALQALTRSPSANVIAGLVLDSPVIDWVTALNFQAKAKGIIRPLRAVVYALIGSRWGRPFTGQREPINFARLDFVERAGELRVPILILHSDDDAYVTSVASRELAQERPDIVTLTSFTDAGHTRLWNRDPGRWNSSISRWLSALDGHDVTKVQSTARRGVRRYPTKVGGAATDGSQPGGGEPVTRRN